MAGCMYGSCQAVWLVCEHSVRETRGGVMSRWCVVSCSLSTASSCNMLQVTPPDFPPRSACAWQHIDTAGKENVCMCWCVYMQELEHWDLIWVDLCLFEALVSFSFHRVLSYVKHPSQSTSFLLHKRESKIDSILYSCRKMPEVKMFLVMMYYFTYFLSSS